MSIEEHARAIEERLDWLATYHVYDDEAVEFLQHRVQDIIDALKWIPVSERIKDDESLVRVRLADGTESQSWYCQQFGWYDLLGEYEGNPVVAWRELV